MPVLLEVPKRARSTYVLGLTATPVRQDGRHFIIHMQCGPIRYRIDKRLAEDAERNNLITDDIVRPVEGGRVPLVLSERKRHLQFLKERIEERGLDCTLLVSWKGVVQHYVGRIHRRYAGKDEVRVYDYVDTHVPVSAASFKRRARSYRRMGYKVRGEEKGQR